MRILVLLTAFITHLSFAQQTYSGSVIDEKGTPLPSVNVVVQGTENGVSTDFDGNFSIKANQGDTLVFSYIGFKNHFEILKSSSNINITLVEDSELLEETIVIGYGTSRKVDLTGSIVGINAEELVEQPALNATQAIQGKVTGVSVVASGAPGSSPTVTVRGLGTVLGGENPLYVVDGLETTNISHINTRDILKMDILKDPSSLAIYGNQGANGVIIITTKKGKRGDLKIDFNTSIGVKSVLSKVQLANASSFLAYANETPEHVNLNNTYFTDGLPYNTDWFDKITQTGILKEHSLSISGASEKSNYFFSAGYLDEEGILIGHDFNRVTVRSNVSHKLFDSKLKISHNIALSLDNTNNKPYSTFTSAYKQAPTVPVRDSNGFYGQPFNATGGTFNNVGNPVADLELHNEKNKRFRLIGAINLDYEIVENLVFTSRFNIETGTSKRFNFSNSYGRFLAFANPNNTPYDESAAKTILSINRGNYTRWNADNFITYKKRFNDVHNVKILAGIVAGKGVGEFVSATANNVLEQSNYWSISLGDTQGRTVNQVVSNPVTSIGYFTRFNYNYQDKYILNASYRRDGASQFYEGGNFWGNFWSFGAGWIVTKENFMENIDLFNNLKIRGSWGQLGNKNVPLNRASFKIDGISYPFGSNTIHSGITTTDIIVPIGWEITEGLNFGIEFTMLNNKLSGEIDYYKKLNTNALLNISPPNVFGDNSFVGHAGEIENKGFEFALNWNDTINKLKYSIGVDLTANKNEFKSFTTAFAEKQSGGSLGNGQTTKRLEAGQPLGSFYLWNATGVDEFGEFVFEDTNGNGITGEEDPDDRQYVGSINPDFYMGFNINLDYKNFDFLISAYSSVGSKVYNGKKAQRFGGENIEQTVADNRWTSSNTDNVTPLPNNDVPIASTYFLESGDYLRINNITLGYNFNTEHLSFLKNLRLYAIATNPIIWKKFSGFTPELGGSPLGGSGIELNSYPSVKSFMFGINVNF